MIDHHVHIDEIKKRNQLPWNLKKQHAILTHLPVQSPSETLLANDTRPSHKVQVWKNVMSSYQIHRPALQAQTLLVSRNL